MKKNFLYLIFTLVSILTMNLLSAQNLSQTIRGTVIDMDGKFPVSGASVFIPGSEPLKGTITNSNGEFRLQNVPLGRITIQINFLGYEPKNLPNIIVESGKEVILQVEIKESLVTMKEIHINGTKTKGEVINEMAIISSRSFSVEETKRYAGSFQDPSRMVSAFAGVTSDPSGNNDIIVRGNSPKGILWRMDGIEIPNPNHFGNEGATGGPINALNSELLSNSDFYTGAFSPEYGDVLSGVFDMKMRPGNNEKHEYSVGIGVLGTDITAEGPFHYNYKGSYLVNYRYSSLSMLNQLGLVDFDGVPKYQDASFKILLPTKKTGVFSIFGIGGLSKILQTETDDSKSNRIVEKVDYGAQLGTICLQHSLPVTINSFIKTSISLSNNGSNYIMEKTDNLFNLNDAGKGDWEKNSFRCGLMYSLKISNRSRIIAGYKFTRHTFKLYEYYLKNEYNRWIKGIDTDNSAISQQSYLSWKYRINENLTFVGGVHALHYSMNKDWSIEPRLALSWTLTPKHTINLGYGQHSKAESLVAYYTNVNTPDGEIIQPNKQLELSKAKHFVLGYEYHISKNMNSKIDFYYQNLYNIPVENVDTSNFSIINSDEGYIDRYLVNKGSAYNLGVEYTLEHYFIRNFYFIFTASLYDSKYRSLEGKLRNTKFNGNYAANFLTGKEFRLGNSGKANTLGINIKYYFSGGRPYIPVNIEDSKMKRTTVYDYSKAWDKKLDDIIQVNLSISYRINRPKTSHEIILDISNITQANARVWEYYNQYSGKIDYYRQLNMIPNFMYRIYF